jgi:transketolase N-terminal domain/subunit
VTGDATERQRISQRATTAQERDWMIASQRHCDGAAQVFLARNGVQP